MKAFPRFSLLLFSFILFLFLVILPQLVLSRPVKQPFKSLKHLQGCHKGQKVKGLHELKQYLEEFGYLSYPHSNNNSLNTHAKDDEFDDRLEAAVKTYQLNYNLNVTGTVDSETVKQLVVPRCGVPDIINGTSSMLSGKKTHHHDGSTTLHTVAHFAFFPNRPKWPASKRNLRYRFSSSAQISAVQDLRFVCSRAFARWAQVSHFTFQEAAEGTPADIVIGFHRGDHGDGYPFDGRGSVLAHAFAPTNGRFHYDADENWSTNPSGHMMDLESVAVHEIGHVLGLGHSSVPDAIMYPSISSGVKKRDLNRDDIEGIQTLYRT